MNEIINSAELVVKASSQNLAERSKQFDGFKQFVKNELVDGVDFGQIPKVDRPSLFKSGGEKIQMFLGLTPQYKLLNREFIQNREVKDKIWNKTTSKYETKESFRNYYAWEWSCELWYGDKKVSEGVGMGNTEERKYISQYAGNETSDSIANTVMKISKKRAFMDAIIAVAGISDMFTQDIEDDEIAQKLKFDKTSSGKKLTKSEIKELYAVIGAYSLTEEEIKPLLKELKVIAIKDITPQDRNIFVEKLKELAKSKKGEK